MRYHALAPLARIAEAGQAGPATAGDSQRMQQSPTPNPARDGSNGTACGTTGSSAGHRGDPAAPVGARRQNLTAGTRPLYAGDWTRFAAFCAATSARSLPADPETVAAFLAAPGAGRSVNTRRLAAIDRRHG